MISDILVAILAYNEEKNISNVLKSLSKQSVDLTYLISQTFILQIDEEEIEMHRVSDDHISVESMNEDNQRADIFQDFNMQLMRSGAVIHHQLGTESNGTFVLDAAVTPDELRIDLPTGFHFSGTRVRNYFE